jgi:hypothetical protein
MFTPLESAPAGTIGRAVLTEISQVSPTAIAKDKRNSLAYRYPSFKGIQAEKRMLLSKT